MASAGRPGHAPVMDNKTRLIEMEVAACCLAAAMIAFTLMLGHGLWKSLAGK
jgi:hypothetical protein